MSKDRNRRAPSSAATRAEKPRSGDRPLAWPEDPEGLTADAVDFEALAHVLANTCRRGGRLRRFHSLAAHAVLMSEEIEALGEPGPGTAGRRRSMRFSPALALRGWGPRPLPPSAGRSG